MKTPLWENYRRKYTLGRHTHPSPPLVRFCRLLEYPLFPLECTYFLNGCYKNTFLTPALRRLLCIALIQPHFDYVCPAWYPNLTKKLKQNKCVRFLLTFSRWIKTSHKEFGCLNWLVTRDLQIQTMLMQWFLSISMDNAL